MWTLARVRSDYAPSRVTLRLNFHKYVKYVLVSGNRQRHCTVVDIFM